MNEPPNVPLRLELDFEVPGTPEQVWHAIATEDGLRSWFIQTDLQEREGGAVCFHMGEEISPGTVTGWEPPHRIAYTEPDWASLAGHDPASVTPMVTEFLVRAQSGGTCVVRVVSSAFGSGADWEREFFDEMEQGWTPYFDHLRLYLRQFAGQRATTFEAMTAMPGEAAEMFAAMRRALGAEQEGQQVRVGGQLGVIERIGGKNLLLRLTDAIPGYLALFVYRSGEGKVTAQVNGYLFPDSAADLAADFAEREKPRWQQWLRSLAVPAA